MLYRALKTADSNPEPWAKFVWNNKAPPRVKFYVWLLSQGRLQCKANLARKRIVEGPVCDICHAADEMAHHVIFGCSAAKQFWEATQIPTDDSWSVTQLQQITPPTHILAKHFQTFLLLCCWHIWKQRNNSLQEWQDHAPRNSYGMQIEAQLWKVRLPKKDRDIAAFGVLL